MRIILAAFAVVVLIGGQAWADGPVVKQSSCGVSWTAPQQSADGSNLADLKEYRVYVAATAVGLAAQTAPIAVVPAPEVDPPAGKTGAWPCKSLAIGQWYVTVTAADTAGNESVRPAAFPFVLADDVSPQAPGSLLVGP